MRNCLIAQSGGPTAVINASVVGVVLENYKNNYYDKVYAGLNGIEGILNRKLIDMCSFSIEELNLLKHTPSAALGSCRYKLKNHSEALKEYENFFQILKENHIKTFFYIGGNDSMDTVNKLHNYAVEKNIPVQIIGIPKTIDNDLPITDHTPGFGSAAKLISTTALECFLDSSVYSNNGIFIMETMGRDAGWLACSSALAKLKGKPVVDFIYLPEVAFNKEKFLFEVEKRYKEKKQVFIVVSEGIKEEGGSFLEAAASLNVNDKFGHVQLGGVCGTLKQLILQEGITNRVKTLELGIIQRCAMHFASNVDIEEAYNAGSAALLYSMEGISGYMVGIKRLSNFPYKSTNFIIETSKVANKIKLVPESYIDKENSFINNEVIEYIEPLIMDCPNLKMENGIPKYIRIK